MSISAVGGAGAAMPMHAMSGASGAGASPRQKMSNLFDAIDTTGSGRIDQAQFNQAFSTKNPPAVFRNAGAQSVWDGLDPSGAGTVSRDSFISAMTGLMASLRAQTPAAANNSGATTVSASIEALQAVGSSNAPGSLLNFSA